MSIKRVTILFSGEGENLENIIKKLHPHTIEIVAAITNNPLANGIPKAQKLGIETIVIDHRDFKKREEFDQALVKIITPLNIDLAILAGFMRILTPVFTDNIKAINIHPSLLPLFKGAHAIEESFNSNMKVAGVSTHLVNSQLDSGDIIDQVCFNKEDMDFQTFKNKITQIEHELFPKSIKKVLLL